MGDLSRIASAIAKASRSPLAFARAAARLPLEREAAARIAQLPVVELTDLVRVRGAVSVALSPPTSRHGWSLGIAEQVVLQIVLKERHAQTAFEIGTFNGGTTRVIAEALPQQGRVWTMDLPAQEFDRTQSPAGLGSRAVGYAYRDSLAASKVTQIYANSLTFDFTPYEKSADLVLVDGGHGREHGLSDTRAALRLVRPGGIILWDDFEPYWHGLVGGICDAMENLNLGRLAGTSLAIYCA